MMKTPRALLGPALAAAALALAACSGSSDTDLMGSANALLAKNDHKGAIIQLKSALQKNPESAQARLLLGKALLVTGDAASALVELRKAQELQVPDEQVIPEIARAMLLVGEETKLIAQYGDMALRDNAAAADLKTSVATARAVKGDSDGARRGAAEALSLQPGFAAAMLLKARLSAAGGDIDAALQEVDSLLAKEPAHEAAASFKGDLLWRGKKDLEGAAQAFAAVIAAHPTSVPAFASSIAVLLEQKKVDQARAQFEQMRKAAPTHAETLFIEAQFAFADKKYEVTRELMGRVLKVAPENVRSLELAGAAEYRLKNFAQAEALLAHAIKNVPGLLMARQLLAQTYLRTGQPEKTIAVLQPLLESKGVDGTALALAGEAWLQMGDARKSEAAFQAAAKASPEDSRVRTSAALAQMARGNGTIAAAELESIAAEDAGPRADLALISARLKLNDIPGALKAIDGLQRKLPDRALPYNLRGRVLLARRDTAGAAKNFEAALAKEPNYFPAIASLAALDFTEGRIEAARKRFDDFLKAQPKSAQAMLALAEIGVRTGAPADEVAGMMRNAVKVNPQETGPHTRLVGYLLGAGEAKSALTAAQEAVAAMPQNPEMQDLLGRAQLAAGEANQAVITYKQLAGQQPSNPMHQVRLADAHVANKDPESAARALDRALEIQPGFAAAKRGKVALALLDKRPQDALALVRDAQKASPQDGSAWSMEGDIEAGRRNWDAAAAAYRGAVQRNPQPDPAAKLHNALRQGGKAAEADRWAADWLKSHPKDALFRYYLGDVALANNDLPRAESHYRSVLELQPRNALALNNVAWIMVKQGKTGAVALAEQAVGLMPNRAPLLDTLALALAADKQLPKAIEVQRRSVALSPQDASLKLNLARMLVQSGNKAMARAELEDLAKLGDKFPAQAEVATLLKSL